MRISEGKDHDHFRNHPNRHRRLGVRPVERELLSAETAQDEAVRHAASELRAIEVNGTYYGSQKPATFAKWASYVPDGFVFFAEGQPLLYQPQGAGRGEPVDREIPDPGHHRAWRPAGADPLAVHGHQAIPSPTISRHFCSCCQKSQDGIALQHVVEPRHASFQVPEFIELLARYDVAAVLADHDDYPMFADVTPISSMRDCRRAPDEIPTCYPLKTSRRWAERFKTYAGGGTPGDLPPVAPNRTVEKKPRDVFAFFHHRRQGQCPAWRQGVAGSGVVVRVPGP